MAKFKIDVPEDVFRMASTGAVWMRNEIEAQNLPTYPDFVNNLMKEMPTVADELHHACTGIAGEAGELLDTSKKVWAYGKPLDLANVIEELGDLRFYYQALLNMLMLTDDEIKAQNMIKLRKRYADGKYSNEQAIARADKVPGAGRKFMGKPDLVVTRGDGVPLPDQAQAIEDFKAACLVAAEREVVGTAPPRNPAEVLRDIAQQREMIGGPPVDDASFDAAAKELDKQS